MALSALVVLVKKVVKVVHCDVLDVHVKFCLEWFSITWPFAMVKWRGR